MFIYIDEMGIGIFTGFGIIIALIIYIARIIILRDGRELKLKHKIILFTRLALVSSFLFADVNDPNVLTTKNEIAP
tara:strand:- start:37 stop:264 length:228 start_codon:yes stop_codon:yes gene_type:complete